MSQPVYTSTPVVPLSRAPQSGSVDPFPAQAVHACQVLARVLQRLPRPESVQLFTADHWSTPWLQVHLYPDPDDAQLAAYQYALGGRLTRTRREGDARSVVYTELATEFDRVRIQVWNVNESPLPGPPAPNSAAPNTAADDAQVPTPAHLAIPEPPAGDGASPEAASGSTVAAGVDSFVQPPVSPAAAEPVTVGPTDVSEPTPRPAHKRRAPDRRSSDRRSTNRQTPVPTSVPTPSPAPTSTPTPASGSARTSAPTSLPEPPAQPPAGDATSAEAPPPAADPTAEPPAEPPAGTGAAATDQTSPSAYTPATDAS